jgi:hypothetical protein
MSVLSVWLLVLNYFPHSKKKKRKQRSLKKWLNQGLGQKNKDKPGTSLFQKICGKYTKIGELKEGVPK